MGIRGKLGEIYGSRDQVSLHLLDPLILGAGLFLDGLGVRSPIQMTRTLQADRCRYGKAVAHFGALDPAAV